MRRTLTGGETGLVGYWRFDEGTGTTAMDLSQFGNHGTLNGPAWVESTAPIGAEAILISQYHVHWNTANRGDAAAEGGWHERIVITNLTTGAALWNEQIAVAGDLAPGTTVANQFSFTPTQPGR